MPKNMEEIQLKRTVMPVLAMRGLVLFPGISMQVDVGRPKSILAIKAALEQDRNIFLVTQVDLSDNEPGKEDLYKIGVVAKIKQVIHNKDRVLKIQIEGIKRAELVDTTSESPYILGEIEQCSEEEYNSTTRTTAMIRIAQEKYEEYLHWFKNVPPDILIKVMKEKNCGALADFIAANIGIEYEQKQFVLEELHPVKRLKRLCDVLTEEISILKVETEISQKAQMQIDENQREYILREQLKVISSELGDEGSQEECEDYKAKILSLKLASKIEKKLLSECEKLQRMPHGAQESGVIKSYLDFTLNLPWNKSSNKKIDIKKAEKILERDHFGLKKVKERFVELLAVRELVGDNANPQIICLVGPPGVGKTSIAKSVASAMGREYVRVSLGGIQDVADIMGHRRTYVGSMAGRIMSAIKQAGTNNPLILLDEIDKLGQSFKGDPSSSLLEVLDPEQNKEFQDHYVDLPFDLSQVLFLTTANDPSYIPGPLYDRMDVINLTSYTSEEKLQIASKYLLPKQLKNHGVKSTQLKMPKATLNALVENYTREAGVRTLERKIATVCRKIAKEIVTNQDFTSITIKPDMLEEYLGVGRTKDNVSKNDEVGLVNGLAWTSVGGELLPIEVAVMDGTGKIQLTGSLGDVMKESASAAITCVRTLADKLGINYDFYAKKDIHIHAPEGAIPKDGPSAGVAMAVAITSALTGTQIKHNVAMTGEITLQGRVLPIGGLKEKSMAAYKNGIDTVLIPFDNIPDLSEVDDIVKKNINFIPVKKVWTAFQSAFTQMPEPEIINNITTNSTSSSIKDICQ